MYVSENTARTPARFQVLGRTGQKPLGMVDYIVKNKALFR